jgi:ubiquinone/menaquinone biosynthesis C-methylase UbiE
MTFKTSKDSYDNSEGAKNYLDFLASEDGQYFRKALFGAFKRRLGSDNNQSILDVACGPGWLSAELSKTHPNIEACDGSRFFLDHARTTYPGIKFTEVDLNKDLPYGDGQFDTLIMSMAAHDVEDQVATFSRLHRILKPGGRIMLTMVNPYYAYPVGVWKRGIVGRLLMRMPRLLVRPYHWFSTDNRNFTFNKTLECYFYKMSEHLNHITESGFTFSHMYELESKEDSESYNLKYRLHRFPVIIYLEFKK